MNEAELLFLPFFRENRNPLYLFRPVSFFFRLTDWDQRIKKMFLAVKSQIQRLIQTAFFVFSLKTTDSLPLIKNLLFIHKYRNDYLRDITNKRQRDGIATIRN